MIIIKLKKLHKKEKAEIKDLIMCCLIEEFNKNKNLKNNNVFLFDKQERIYNKTKEKEILYDIKFLNKNSYNKFIIDCLIELENDKFITMYSSSPDHFLEGKEIIIFTTSYYCNFITELGKIKMQNGGFLKEYNDKIEKRNNKIFTYCISIITLIYTIKEIIF